MKKLPIERSVWNIIQRRLDKIEKEEKVKILYACESGSRAWGFASADSDYDVRFIYVHSRDWYLSIESGRDVIERPLKDEIDLSGWDFRKALGLFRKSNPPFLEWMQSPIVYRTRSNAADKIRRLIPKCYSPRNCMHHYFRMADHNFRAYLCRDKVKVKKYFYVLRPILGCRWIEAKLGPVPMEFYQMVEKVVDSNVRLEVDRLLERKKHGLESDLEPPIPVLHHFLENELKRFSKSDIAAVPKYADTKVFDQLFLKYLQ
jgi:uncharacterized protein